jgi:hypothetical protein
MPGDLDHIVHAVRDLDAAAAFLFPRRVDIAPPDVAAAQARYSRPHRYLARILITLPVPTFAETAPKA